MTPSTLKRRHKWAPVLPERDVCLRDDCGMFRTRLASALGPRAEYRDRDFRFIRNQPVRDPAPPCQPSKETR